MRMNHFIEFQYLTQDILEYPEFLKLKSARHHGITRYDHSFRVALYTYYVTKFLGLNYSEATRGALLHDFFLDEVKNENGFMRLVKHPRFALENARKHFGVSMMQEDLILRHMFPVTIIPPKYLESWIVDIVDDVASVYERVASMSKEVKTSVSSILLFLIHLIH